MTFAADKTFTHKSSHLADPKSLNDSVLCLETALHAAMQFIPFPRFFLGKYANTLYELLIKSVTRIPSSLLTT